MVFDMRVTGIDSLKALLAALPRTMRSMIIVPIVTKLVAEGARIARTNLVRVLPKRDPARRWWDRPTGALRDSLGSKVVPLSKMRNKDVVFGLFGARLDFRVSKRTVKRLASQGKFVGRPKRYQAQSGLVVPAKYIHLVERGHRGSPRHRIPPARAYPFMGPARTAIQAMLPGFVRQEFGRLYPLVIERMRRRYVGRINTASGSVVA